MTGRCHGPDDDEDAVRSHIAEHMAEHMDAMFRIDSPQGMLPGGAEFPRLASENPQVTQEDTMTEQRMTELDDAIEQVLGDYIPDALWRTQARNRVCRLIAEAGYDVYAPVAEPADLPVISAAEGT